MDRWTGVLRSIQKIVLRKFISKKMANVHGAERSSRRTVYEQFICFKDGCEDGHDIGAS